MGSVTVTDISQSFTRKMAAKINWHRYGTKLRHCRPVYYYTRLAFRGLSVCLSVCRHSFILSQNGSKKTE